MPRRRDWADAPCGPDTPAVVQGRCARVLSYCPRTHALRMRAGDSTVGRWTVARRVTWWYEIRRTAGRGTLLAITGGAGYSGGSPRYGRLRSRPGQPKVRAGSLTGEGPAPLGVTQGRVPSGCTGWVPSGCTGRVPPECQGAGYPCGPPGQSRGVSAPGLRGTLSGPGSAVQGKADRVCW